MRTLWRDIRYGARTLAKSPGFAAVAVLALGLGIGANTAIFSVINAVLLRPLPYKDPERLVRITEQGAKLTLMAVSYPNFLDWRAQASAFEQMAAMQTDSYNLSGGGGEAERLAGRNVSPEFFPVLGVEPALGRLFTEEENAPGVGRVAVISHGLWQRRFGADPRVVGQPVTLNGEPFTVVGVLPQGFHYGAQTDVYVPINSALDDQMRSSRGYHPGIFVLARLKEGVSFEQASAEMAAISARLAQQYPDSNTGNSARVRLLSETLVGGLRPALFLLLGAVGMVLLIACANVANLLLARAAARQQEIAVRTALGASRLRIARQFLTESVLLALGGGCCGLMLALWSLDYLRSLIPGGLPTAEIGLDANVLVFTLGVSVATGVLFGLAPALQASRADLNTVLKGGGRTQSAGAGRQRVRSGLVVAEVALSLLLLVGAGLLMKSFLRLQQAETGFDPRNLLTMQITRAVGKGEDPARAADFFERLRERLAATAGVEAAAYAAGMPILGAPDTSIMVAGRPRPEPGQAPQAVLYVTSPGYLKALGIRLVRGRFFEESDVRGSQHVAVIDEEFARILFPGEDPIGQRLDSDWLGPEVPDAEIVGVVEHVSHYGVGAPEQARAQLYYAFKQVPEKFLPDFLGGVFLVARAKGDPAALAPAVRREAQQLDPHQPVYAVATMEDVLAQRFAARRLSTLLLGLFAGLAFVLAAVGLYGVMSYTVTQRRHEIGIRMALGAQPRDVLRMVVGQGMLLTGFGIGLGLAGAFAASRLMSGLLYGVSATDPATFAAVSLALALVALLANYFPARRAMKVDPLVALRYE
ncbi:MAG TPA: ABC transporter permease [Pyrinomonadaceae bacterium]|nr:ABC transporter permease [Pyrinomonadaceae bacterium]